MKLKTYYKTTSFVLTKGQIEKIKATAKLLGVKQSDVVRDLIEHSLPTCSIHKEFLDEFKSIILEGPVRPVLPYVAALLDMKTPSPWQVEYSGEKYDIDAVETNGYAAKLRIVQRLFELSR